MLVIPELNCRLLYNYCSDPGSDCGILLGSTPATLRYNVCPKGTFAHGAIRSQEGG